MGKIPGYSLLVTQKCLASTQVFAMPDAEARNSKNSKLEVRSSHFARWVGDEPKLANQVLSFLPFVLVDLFFSLLCNVNSVVLRFLRCVCLPPPAPFAGRAAGGQLNDRSFTESEVCSVMSQVIRALVYMHETAKICHRDLKVGVHAIGAYIRQSDRYWFCRSLADVALSRWGVGEWKRHQARAGGRSGCGFIWWR